MDSSVLRWRRSVLDRAAGSNSAGELVLNARVQAAFWLVAAVLTLGLVVRDPQHSHGRVAGMLLTMVLVHELARNLAARLLHLPSRVVLRMLGPRTIVDEASTSTKMQAVIVLCGCLANAVVAIAAYALARRLRAESSTFFALAFCHASYGLAHLLPFAPFDARALLTHASSQRRVTVLAACAGALGLASFIARLGFHAPYISLGLALLALFPLLSLAPAVAETVDERRGFTNLIHVTEANIGLHDHVDTRARLRLLLQLARSSRFRTRILRALARAELSAGHAAHAVAAMQQLPDDEIDVVMLATLMHLLGDETESIRLLEEARALGTPDPAVTKMLIDLHFLRGDAASVSSIAARDGAILSSDDRFRILSAVGSLATTRSSVR